jgi:protein tyrosine phosphatase
MVWEQRCGVIVMATREFESGKLKCHQYWPTQGASVQAGSIEVHLTGEDSSSPDYVIRRLRLQSSVFNEVREIIHLQMVTWPDQGVPDTAGAFLNFLEEARSAEQATIARGLTGPTVCHCSAGIGRTGSYMTLDTCLRRLVDPSVHNVDVASTVAYFRNQRAGTVQTVSQYRFVYEAIAEFAAAHGIEQKARAGESAGLTDAELRALAELAGPSIPGMTPANYLTALNNLNIALDA